MLGYIHYRLIHLFTGYVSGLFSLLGLNLANIGKSPRVNKSILARVMPASALKPGYAGRRRTLIMEPCAGGWAVLQIWFPWRRRGPRCRSCPFLPGLILFFPATRTHEPGQRFQFLCMSCQGRIIGVSSPGRP